MTSSVLAVLLAAAGALAWGDRSAQVLRRLTHSPSRTPPPRLPPAVRQHLGRRAVPLVGGSVVLAVLAGLPLVAVVLGVGGTAVVLPARRREAERSAYAGARRRQLPRAADLLATCLAAGSTPADAVGVVAEAVGGPLGRDLMPVAATLRLGVDPAVAWAPLASTDPALRRLAVGFTRAAATGAPLAVALGRLAAAERERSRTDAEVAARRAGVLAVGPLAACFLPAFVLLGVVPLVAGIAGEALGGVR